VNIETQALKLHVKREPDQKVFKSTPVPTVAATAPVQAQLAAAPAAAPRAEAAPVAAGKNTIEIKSPMIGTFYPSKPW
jgi:acetyl-CoA carboxylase biotin carboxyl carrier protein